MCRGHQGHEDRVRGASHGGAEAKPGISDTHLCRARGTSGWVAVPDSWSPAGLKSTASCRLQLGGGAWGGLGTAVHSQGPVEPSTAGAAQVPHGPRGLAHCPSSYATHPVQAGQWQGLSLPAPEPRPWRVEPRAWQCPGSPSCRKLQALDSPLMGKSSSLPGRLWGSTRL